MPHSLPLSVYSDLEAQRTRLPLSRNLLCVLLWSGPLLMMVAVEDESGILRGIPCLLSEEMPMSPSLEGSSQLHLGEGVHHRCHSGARVRACLCRALSLTHLCVSHRLQLDLCLGLALDAAKLVLPGSL